jgi:hypothetical protein
MRDI